MKSLSKILLAATLIAGSAYTYAKPVNTVKINSNDQQDRHLSGFTGIDVSGSFDVVITQGGTESVKIEAPGDVMSHIITEVDGGVLRIHDKNNSGWHFSGWGHKKILIYVTVKEINQIAVTGSGDVSFKEGIRAGNLKIRVSGSGDVIGKIEAKTLDCNISGSGDMKLFGHVQSQNVSVSGSGDYSGRDLATVNTTVHVSGSGDAAINASENVEASVSGSGDINYSGGAQHVVQSKSGSGDISRG